MSNSDITAHHAQTTDGDGSAFDYAAMVRDLRARNAEQQQTIAELKAAAAAATAAAAARDEHERTRQEAQARERSRSKPHSRGSDAELEEQLEERAQELLAKDRHMAALQAEIEAIQAELVQARAMATAPRSRGISMGGPSPGTGGVAGGVAGEDASPEETTLSVQQKADVEKEMEGMRALLAQTNAAMLDLEDEKHRLQSEVASRDTCAALATPLQH